MGTPCIACHHLVENWKCKNKSVVNHKGIRYNNRIILCFFFCWLFSCFVCFFLVPGSFQLSDLI